MFHYTALTWTDCPIWWCPHGTSFEPGLWKSSRRQQRWARDSGNESSGQVIEAIGKFRVFTSWVTNTCRVADFLSFMIVRHELTSKTEVCRYYENNQHAILSSKCWSKEMRTSDVEGGESVEVEIQKNVYGAALLAIAQVSVAGTRLEHDGIMIAWFLPFKIHHNRDIWVPKSVKDPKFPR